MSSGGVEVSDAHCDASKEGEGRGGEGRGGKGREEGVERESGLKGKRERRSRGCGERMGGRQLGAEDRTTGHIASCSLSNAGTSVGTNSRAVDGISREDGSSNSSSSSSKSSKSPFNSSSPVATSSLTLFTKDVCSRDDSISETKQRAQMQTETCENTIANDWLSQYVLPPQYLFLRGTQVQPKWLREDGTSSEEERESGLARDNGRNGRGLRRRWSRRRALLRRLDPSWETVRRWLGRRTSSTTHA